MKKVKLLIDTDIGDEIDDALALYFAMREGYEIIGITTVYKNTDERARITKRLLQLYGKGYEGVPVFAGEGTPIAEAPTKYPHTCHYREMLDAVDYAPDGGGDAAIDFIIESCEKYGEELAIVAIGPFTNIAKAIEKNKAAVNKAGAVVIMGGAYYRQYADWNVMCDVEAADIMFSSLENLECMGADVTHQLLLDRAEHQRLMDENNIPQFTDTILNGNQPANDILQKYALNMSQGFLGKHVTSASWKLSEAATGGDNQELKAVEIWSSPKTNVFLPTAVMLTNEENEIVNPKLTIIKTMIEEYSVNYILGQTDKSFDTFVEELRANGATEVENAYQAAYERYLNR